MRLFSARSFALLALAIAPVLVRADTQFVDGVWTYKYDEYLSNPDPRIEIVKASTSVSGDVVVPSTLGGYPVVSLGAESFYRCSSMTSVTIPDCVTSIGDDAFKRCTALTNVVIGSGVASIGEYAFSTCANLATVYLPASYDGPTDMFPDNVDIVIYGAPEPVQVTVSFDANGAEGDVPDAIVCEEGSAVTLPDAENLTWANRSFTGWLYEGSVLQPGDDFTVGSTNVVLSAVWRKVVETFNDWLDNDDLEFATGGDALWLKATNTVAKVGESCVRSGAVGMEQSSYLETTVYGQGTLTFWWKVSCEPDPRHRYTYDNLSFATNGVVIARIDGEAGWEQQSLTFDGDGAHTVRWTYATDDWEEPGYSDCGWIDGITWSGSGPATSDPIPQLPLDATPEAVTNAIESAGFADSESVMAAIGGSAAEYAAFKTWAQSVKGVDGTAAAGEAAVVANTNAAAAYLLGAERLFGNLPNVSFGTMTVDAAAQMSLSVVVKDGDEAVKCSADKVKDMFEATSDLENWTQLPVTVTVEEPVAGDDAWTMRFKAVPDAGVVPRAFVRIKVK